MSLHGLFVEDQKDSKKFSDSENEDESQKSSSRLQTWNQDYKQSPKSPKSPKSDRSDSSPRRLLSRNLNRFDQDLNSPSPPPLKALKSPRTDKNDNFMLTTLKKPLNTEKFRTGNKIGEIEEEQTPRLESKKSPKGLVKLQLDSPRDKYKMAGMDDEKERFKNILGGGKSLKPLSPTANRNVDPLILKKTPEPIPQKPTKSPPILKREMANTQSPKNSRPTTPSARTEAKKPDDHRTSFDKSSALLDALLPDLKPKPVPILRKNSEEKKE
jgi:hypothetical protein